jgi:hypothetical protein
MSRPVRILLQTTIPAVEDDWNVESFSLLREHLESLKTTKAARSAKSRRATARPNSEGDDEV